MADPGLRLSSDPARMNAARNFLTTFCVLLKTARLYAADNELYRKQAVKFYRQLTQYMENRSNATLKFIDKRFFIDDYYINFDDDDKLGSKGLVERLTELGIGGIIIGNTVTDQHLEALIKLLTSFEVVDDGTYDKVCDELAEAGADSISLLGLPDVEVDDKLEDDQRREIRQKARDTFFRAISTVQEMTSALTGGQDLSVNRTRRVVHTIIDQLSEDESALIELASIKDFDNYTYAHSVNVCIYSLTLGFRLNLSRPELSELGFAALFHDIGKIKLPNSVVTKPDTFDEFDWSEMFKHPVLGAMTIAKNMRFDRHMSRAAAAAFEHHINYDGTGYPRLEESRSINLFSRIISITDCFDALTSGRVYIKKTIPPDEVLRKMMYQMHTKFDKILLELFVSIIGIYPVGSLVLLSNDSLAIITANNPQDWHRPEVRIIADKNGEVEDGIFCHLGQPENYSLDIVKIVDPFKHNIDVTKYILEY